MLKGLNTNCITITFLWPNLQPQCFNDGSLLLYLTEAWI